MCASRYGLYQCVCVCASLLNWKMKKCEADYAVNKSMIIKNCLNVCEWKMAWGDDDGGDKKKGCFKCGEKIREIYVPKEEIDDSKLFESCAVICVNGV